MSGTQKNIGINMAYKIIETESFKKSLTETFDYISEKFKDPMIINDMLDIIDSVSSLLRIFPDMFAVFEPSYKLDVIVRKFPVKDYFVFYTIDDILHEVQYIKIMHSRRNYYEINYFKQKRDETWDSKFNKKVKSYGSMFRNEMTPDGKRVDVNGKRIE